MNFVDIHTHSYYQDPESLLVLNVFPGENEKLHLKAYLSVGLHPWHVEESSVVRKLEQVSNAARLPLVIAIGETGLDKVVSNPFQFQVLAFERQLAIAESLGKPLVIHCVRSYSEMLAYRKKSDQSIPWIFHWFNADEQIAEKLLRKNCYLSFGHMLFKEHSKAFTSFASMPVERVFFETDDAGITIQDVYERAAAIRKIGMGELKMQIMDNFARCFNITGNGKLVKPD